MVHVDVQHMIALADAVKADPEKGAGMKIKRLLGRNLRQSQSLGFTLGLRKSTQIGHFKRYRSLLCNHLFRLTLNNPKGRAQGLVTTNKRLERLLQQLMVELTPKPIFPCIL